MDIKTIIQSEASQKEKNKYCVLMNVESENSAIDDLMQCLRRFLRVPGLQGDPTSQS